MQKMPDFYPIIPEIILTDGRSGHVQVPDYLLGDEVAY